MSFDALTIGGFVLALLAAGLLIGIVRGNDKASEVRRRLGDASKVAARQFDASHAVRAQESIYAGLVT